MNKFILLSFLLTVLAANTDATVAPFSCYYTTPGKGSSEPPVLSAPNCVTACYRVTATGGIPLGKNVVGSNNPANSINGVITTLVSTAGNNLASGGDQKTHVIGVGVPSQIGVQPHGTTGATTNGVASLGNIGIITLPQETSENGLKDFVLNDRGCLPILALQTTPQNAVVRASDDSNQIPYTIGRTCTAADYDAAIGKCGTLVTCSFGADKAGCLIGSAKTVAAGAVAGNGRNDPSGTSGTVVVTLPGAAAASGTTHVRQQLPTVSGAGVSSGGIPLQLAYNPIIGGAAASATAVSDPIQVPKGIAASNELSWPNLLANSQVNQAALDLAAVTVLFCVTSGVCCTSNACNTIPVVTTKSSSTSLNNNIIIILMSIICSMSF